jgi:Rod binding domain-containing protein
MDALGLISATSSASSASVSPQVEASVRDSAQKFESFMLQQMFREMRQSSFSESMSDSSKSYRGMADDQMADHLSKSGGFGFGKAMADQLLAQMRAASGLSGEAKTAVNSLNP